MRNAVLVEKQRREQYQRMAPACAVYRFWMFLVYGVRYYCSVAAPLLRRHTTGLRYCSQAEAVLFLQEEGRNYMARLDARRAAMKGKKGKKGYLAATRTASQVLLGALFKPHVQPCVKASGLQQVYI